MVKRHKHEWKYYDGALGYVSYTCKICGVDINDLKKAPKLTNYSTRVIHLLSGGYAVYLKETSPGHETSKPIKEFKSEAQAIKYANKVKRLRDESKSKLLNKS